MVSRFGKYVQLVFLCTLILFNLFVWRLALGEDEGKKLRVAFLDVGQGDSIFIEAPNGNQMLIDGGPNGKVLEELGKLMSPYDHSIDVLMVTNPDADHYAGFIDVLKNYEVGQILESGTVSVTKTYQTFKQLVAEKGIEDIFVRRGMDIVLDGEKGVIFRVLFPDRGVSNWTSNDGSIMGRLIYASTSIMFTGDGTKKTESIVSSLDGNNLKSDVLKVGHHGSRTSTGENFVRLVAPEYAVISDGRNNRYGHPHKETIETLLKFGVTTFRTDQVGTVRMVSDGEKLNIVGYY